MKNIKKLKGRDLYEEYCRQKDKQLNLLARILYKNGHINKKQLLEIEALKFF